MKALHVLITMDCEPTNTGTHASATGPGSWALGERAVSGYADIARSYGFPISCFVHPETAQAQAPLFNDLRRAGHDVGLHMHPWKYALSAPERRRYMEHFGGLDRDRQRELVAEASDIWSTALGVVPTLFRPGSFSSNDATFSVLAEAGFSGCSCSLPGRQMPEMRANWTGTVLDPHRAHAVFRQLPGTLPLAEVPLTVDVSRQLRGKIGGSFHPDLRPDIDWATLYGLSYDEIASAIVRQIIERDPAVPALQLLTHNQYDFRDPAAAETGRIKAALDAIMAACEREGVLARGAVISDVTQAVLARPVDAEPFVCEGNLYGQQGRIGTLSGH